MHCAITIRGDDPKHLSLNVLGLTSINILGMRGEGQLFEIIQIVVYEDQTHRKRVLLEIKYIMSWTECSETTFPRSLFCQVVILKYEKTAPHASETRIGSCRVA